MALRTAAALPIYCFSEKSGTAPIISTRELHLAVPSETTTAQWVQIMNYAKYAENKGVKMYITEKMTDEEITFPHHRSVILVHNKFILIEAYSGFRRASADPQGEQIYLSPDASPAQIGAALIEALNASRLFTSDNDPQETPESLDGRYEAWIADVKARYRLRSRRALFVPMRLVGANYYYGRLHLRPTRHVKPELWTETSKDGAGWVVIPYPDVPQIVGDAVLLALSRCR